MKTFFYLVMTAFLSVGMTFAGLNTHHILLGYGAAFLLWLLFASRFRHRK